MTLGSQLSQAIVDLETTQSRICSDDITKIELLNRLRTLQTSLMEIDYIPQLAMVAHSDRPISERRHSHCAVRPPSRHGPRDLDAFPDAMHSDSTIESDSEDADSSFARLSYLLEKSIHEGRDALDSTSSAASACLESDNGAPRFELDQIDSGSNDARRMVAADDKSTQENPSHIQRAVEPVGPILLPPSYTEHHDSIAALSWAHAASVIPLVDDSVVALEGLIDQLVTSTLPRRPEAGLTSMLKVLLLSTSILLLVYLVSRPSEPIGVNCHCVC